MKTDDFPLKSFFILFCWLTASSCATSKLEVGRKPASVSNASDYYANEPLEGYLTITNDKDYWVNIGGEAAEKLFRALPEDKAEISEEQKKDNVMAIRSSTDRNWICFLFGKSSNGVFGKFRCSSMVILGPKNP